MASHDIPIGSTQVSLAQLSERSREIFRQIVESYLATGEPVGSRNISRLLQMSLSPASVRNVMSDLEHLGLIYAPHTSAGRLPTELGLRFFVDALMQIGDLNDNDKRAIEAQVAGRGQSYENVLTQASGLAVGPDPRRRRRADRQAECGAQACRVRAARTRARAGRAGCRRRAGRKPHPAGSGRIADLGADRGDRIFSIPAFAARRSANCGWNWRKRWRPAAPSSISSPRRSWRRALRAGRAATIDDRKLIVRGQSHLLDDLKALDDLERVRLLFDDLETRREVIDLLGRAERADGVRIFIGSENKLFSLSGSSTIIAPYRDSAGRIVGVLGVIGPTRLNYARVIPMVDYTAKVVSRMLSGT